MQSRLIDGLEWDLDEGWQRRPVQRPWRQGPSAPGRHGPRLQPANAWSWRCWSAANCAGARPRAWSGSTVRSRYGRLMKALDQHGPLLRVGTTGVDLLELLAEINDTEHFALKGEGRRLVRHTREYLEAGFPVVLGFHGLRAAISATGAWPSA